LLDLHFLNISFFSIFQPNDPQLRWAAGIPPAKSGFAKSAVDGSSRFHLAYSTDRQTDRQTDTHGKVTDAADRLPLAWVTMSKRFRIRFVSNALVVQRMPPSRTTARLQHKNHFRFRLTQLLLLFYDLLSTTCSPLRFQQPTPPVPDEVSLLKLLQLATACTASASRQTG